MPGYSVEFMTQAMGCRGFPSFAILLVPHIFTLQATALPNSRFRRTYAYVARYLVLAALVYMPVFGNLNVLPIREWDEARIAVSAYEVYSGGDWLVTRFHGEPDMWNTKPPFLVWCQAA